MKILTKGKVYENENVFKSVMKTYLQNDEEKKFTGGALFFSKWKIH